MPDRRVRRSRRHPLTIVLSAALSMAGLAAPAAAEDAFVAGLTGAVDFEERRQTGPVNVTPGPAESPRPDAGGRYERGSHVGLAAEIGENWLADLTYMINTDWLDGRPQSKEIALTGGYTARGLLGLDRLSLTPQVKFAIPVEAGDGYYSEIRVTPALAFLQDGDTPIDVSIPITLGVGFDDHRGVENDRTGYVGVGLNGAMTFTAIPQGYGNLTLSADVDVLVRESDAETRTRDNEDFVTIGGLRLRLAY